MAMYCLQRMQDRDGMPYDLVCGITIYGLCTLIPSCDNSLPGRTDYRLVQRIDNHPILRDLILRGLTFGNFVLQLRVDGPEFVRVAGYREQK